VILVLQNHLQLKAGFRSPRLSGRPICKIHRRSELRRQLQRLVSDIEVAIQPNAVHKVLGDLSGAAWIRFELGQRSFEPCQILSDNLVTTHDVLTYFSDHQSLRTSKTPWTNTRELWAVQKAGGSVFARWSEAATGSLRFGFLFQPGEFIH